MGVATRTNVYRSFVIDFKRENRNDKTYFVFNFGSSGIYIVLLDQHNGLKPSS
jgi:hypothetical protein